MPDADTQPPQPLDPPQPPAPPAPLAAAQRIQALDVVRGFALLGIFLMNIESFNRYYGDIFERGIPPEARGLDWAATFFVNYAVQGKFWTMFSTLFGMGFAVMLLRAERAQQDGQTAVPAFLRLFLRRTLALAVFGACHYLFVWDGDILLSYAVGGVLLLMVLYARPWVFVVGIVAGLGLGALAEPAFAIAAGVAVAGLAALWLRSGQRVGWFARALPPVSLLLMAAGLASGVAACLLWVLPDGPVEPRLPLAVFCPLLLLLGWLSWRFHQPAAQRPLRLALGLYVFAGVAATALGLVEHFGPDPVQVLQAQAAAEAPATTLSQRAAELQAERDRRLAEREEERQRWITVQTQGSYGQLVLARGGELPAKLAVDAVFGVLLLSMFLLGMWFVRSGVMQDTAAHLPLFRRMVWLGLPLGLGLSLASAAIATSHLPGVRDDGWGIATGLHMLANLPACLGYIGLVVLMLHSTGPWARIRVLAPLGRMALTHYLLQSLLCAWLFFGHGLGLWGMGRAAQLLLVLVVFAAQLALSHWWLARFQYGPMEWLWRGFTYRELPPLRIRRAAAEARQSPHAARGVAGE